MSLLVSLKRETFGGCKIQGQSWPHRISVFQSVENQRCGCLCKSCSARQSGLKQVQFEKDCVFIFRENQINTFSQSSFEEISIIINISGVVCKLFPKKLSTAEKLSNQGARAIAASYITFH